MTVEILKGPPVFTTINTCPGCKAELKATEPDLKVGSFGGDYVDSGTPGLYFTCPVCDSDVRLAKYPWALLERIRRNEQKQKKETEK